MKACVPKAPCIFLSRLAKSPKAFPRLSRAVDQVSAAAAATHGCPIPQATPSRQGAPPLQLNWPESMPILRYGVYSSLPSPLCT